LINILLGLFLLFIFKFILQYRVSSYPPILPQYCICIYSPPNYQSD
jgi:hypothetical protein